MAKRKTRPDASSSPGSGSGSKGKKAAKLKIYDGPEPVFVGSPIERDEALRLWPHRYDSLKKKVVCKRKGADDDDETHIQAVCHYRKANVDGIVYELYDDAYAKADEGEEPLICKIVEFFEGKGGSMHVTNQWYYRAQNTADEGEEPLICKIVEFFEGKGGSMHVTNQWYYRAQNTVIKNHAMTAGIDYKKIFYSDIQDTNSLDCLLRKLTISRSPSDAGSERKGKSVPKLDYYCDTKYLLPYSSFINLPAEINTSSSISNDVNSAHAQGHRSSIECSKPQVKLLDLYSGCGAMSTGLCLGACSAGVNLVTKWAVDVNKHACESLKFNHPETMVRNESADDFLSLIKEWEKLCVCFKFVETNDPEKHKFDVFFGTEDGGDEEIIGTNKDDPETFDVEQILDMCYGDPNHIKKRGLYCKVRWEGYGTDEDTWEPIEALSHCQECVQEFVSQGYSSNMLPLPGDVDVICGGPPCQGISGFNRFRNEKNPLDDEKNKQLTVFMDFVQHLKPKHVLMENVVDLVKFVGGFLGRYALGRLVDMNYQTRMGIMAAGTYGLPQFRLRIFIWGARPTERLPQYPYPTHDVAVRGCIPKDFERNIVAYDVGQKVKLEKKLFLEDAISDLPPVENKENKDEMPYVGPPKTYFQKSIRLDTDALLHSVSKPWNETLYDHCPLKLNEDAHARVCLVPKRKGANFRNIRVKRNRKYFVLGKPVVPNYAVSFRNGTSNRPFARLWWDETVPTVVTRAEPHNQAVLHPVQDRVLSIRENARLQGFPDYYKLSGPVKERYTQVGNAVAIPVSRSLGYALGLAIRGLSNDEPLFTLPEKFPYHEYQIPEWTEEDD